MGPDGSAHVPVLRDEALEALQVCADGTYVDCTFGRGGHASQILERLGPAGRLIAIDRDPEAVDAGRRLLGKDRRFTIEQGAFSMLEQLAHDNEVLGRVQGILFDLGVSSPQLEQAARGFSFQREGPLDMRMDPNAGESAAQWLARVDERTLSQVFKRFGEERYARRIARAVMQARRAGPITTTRQLAEIIAAAHPQWEPGLHPATRCFQAIRIAVNKELEELSAALEQSLKVLAPAGRLVVISFHSLEDRIVKRFMRREARGDDFPPDLPIRASELHPRLRLVGRAVRPSEEEVRHNPRARSAVLRAAERTA